jgi:iron complex transport system ATP-binding protein
MSVDIAGLTAGYGNVTVLHDIRLEIASGRICALIGHNGSGKTTLMRCINGLLKPSKGKISVSGREICRMRRHEIARLISLVPQGSHSPFQFSAREMVLMGGATRVKAWAAPCAVERRRADQVCQEVGVADLADTPFNNLSGGQKQLVMLARALYQDSPVMLLDEPNSHLDFSNQHKVMGLMRRFVKERGVTALISLHDPNLALYYSDDVVMLKQGRVVAAGPAVEIMDDTHLREAIGANLMLDRTVSGVRVVVPRDVAREN